LTERLVLRELTGRDLPELLDFQTRNRAFFAPWDPLRPAAFFTPEAQRALIRSDRAENRRGTACRLWLFEPGSPRILGFLGLSSIVRGIFLSSFVGWKLDREARGKGYMTEALQALAGLAFGELGLHRLEANIMPRNKPSRRLAERAGFSEEGRSKRYLYIAGRWEDHIHYVRRNRSLEEG
jgi:ribosomal-protein-alanine N-acetyltransferase